MCFRYNHLIMLDGGSVFLRPSNSFVYLLVWRGGKFWRTKKNYQRILHRFVVQCEVLMRRCRNFLMAAVVVRWIEESNNIINMIDTIIIVIINRRRPSRVACV